MRLNSGYQAWQQMPLNGLFAVSCKPLNQGHCQTLEARSTLVQPTSLGSAVIFHLAETGSCLLFLYTPGLLAYELRLLLLSLSPIYRVLGLQMCTPTSGFFLGPKANTFALPCISM